MLAQLLQFLFSGITVGATYALAALGFTLIYNASNVINFAQGEFIMLGGMLAVLFTQAGLPLPAALLLAILLGPGASAVLVLGTALIWSASPVAQLAHNRCHRNLRIGAFGPAADRDCLRQGVTTGMACVATCWPWMLLPALAGAAHLAAMAAVAAFLLAARLAPASPVRWRVPQALEVMFGPRYLTGLSARSRRQK